jgi:hypothetical protein
MWACVVLLLAGSGFTACTGPSQAGAGNNTGPDAAQNSVTQSPLPDTYRGGKAVFAETDHDFGAVEQGEEVTHVFRLRNESDEPLHIKRVRGS